MEGIPRGRLIEFEILSAFVMVSNVALADGVFYWLWG